MTSRTISEKILSKNAGATLSAGDFVVCEPDRILGTDAATPMALDYFEGMDGRSVVHPERVLIAFDHYSPPSSTVTVGFHERVKAFGRAQGICICDVGEGISHQLAAERGEALPGSLVIGADSHTVTLGALNAFATGVGSSDLAAALVCGQVWLRVPETIRVILDGVCPEGVTSKDVALATLRAVEHGGGAGYMAVEFSGSGSADLDMDERFVVSNLMVEMGAKAGIFPADQVTRAYLSGRTEREWEGVESDTDARFAREVVVDIGDLSPLVALPHEPGNVVPIDTVKGEPIDLVFLGTCSGGRAGDFRRALNTLRKGGGPADGVRLVVTPTSREVREELNRDGTLAALEEFGAVITVPGCGPCCGTSGPLPLPGERIISTANRNYEGRMGVPGASIYLASPETCAASATTGSITDPRTLGGYG